MAYLEHIPKVIQKIPWRKKRFWAAMIAVILILVFARVLYVRKQLNRQTSGQAASVQSVRAELGTLTNTVAGSGNLEAAESVDVMIPTGITVKSTLVESGDVVTKGQKLAKLDQASVTSALVEIEKSLESIEEQLDDDSLSDLEIEDLENQKESLEEQQDDMEALYENPVIKATADGIISNIAVSADAEVTETASGSGTANEMALSESRTSLMLLSDSDSAATDAEAKSAEEQLEQISDETNTESSETTTDDTGSTDEETDEKSDQSDEESNTGAADSVSEAEENTVTIRDFSDLSIKKPVEGETMQTEIADTSAYTGRISWNPDDSTAQAGTTYTATVVLTAKSGYVFSGSDLPIQPSDTSKWTVTVSDSGSTMTITAEFVKTADAQTADNKMTAPSSGETGESGGMGASGGAGASGSGSGSASRTASVSSSSGSGTADSSSGSTTTSTSYNKNETAAFTIQKQDNAIVSISVDELDILSVSEGQTAIVTLDAVDGEEFEGTITHVSNMGTTDSSSAKYAVEITLPMESSMRLGMNASATIEVESAENVVTIPMTALQEHGDETFVYTQQNSDGSLSGETIVETGLSNGTTVEITSGLAEGDIVYFTRTESENAESSTNFFGGGKQGMPGGTRGETGRSQGGGTAMPSGGPGGGA